MSNDLVKLRPVTFRYKNDATNTVQYGLVAEEVARVYPELVTYAQDGKVMTVRYQELAPMLLNEVQKQARENHRQAAQIQQLTARSAQQAERIQSLTKERDQDTAENRRLAAQVTQLKGMVEQVMAAQKGNRSVAAAFNK